jgi:hypothetical protein
MGQHAFHFQAVRDLMRIKADGASQSVVVFNFLVQGSHGNAEHTSQLFDRESFLSGAQPPDEVYFVNFSGLARMASGAGTANPRSLRSRPAGPTLSVLRAVLFNHFSTDRYSWHI